MSDMEHEGKVMVQLVNLVQVAESLEFLFKMGIIQHESIAKGCKKFVNDHPEINEYLERKKNGQEPG